MTNDEGLFALIVAMIMLTVLALSVLAIVFIVI